MENTINFYVACLIILVYSTEILLINALPIDSVLKYTVAPFYGKLLRIHCNKVVVLLVDI